MTLFDKILLCIVRVVIYFVVAQQRDDGGGVMMMMMNTGKFTTGSCYVARDQLIVRPKWWRSCITPICCCF
jgi:hypothetical protein